MYGNVCFEKYMKNTPTNWICDCPMECNTISYSFSVVTTPFDPEEMCPDYQYTWEYDFLMKTFYNNLYPPQFIRTLMNIKNNAPDPDSNQRRYLEKTELCKMNLDYRALVNFKLVTDTMSVTVLSRRVSFFDKMSAFGKTAKELLVMYNRNGRFFCISGGTLGLFTGISILSMIEIAFWIVRYVVKHIFNGKEMRNR